MGRWRAVSASVRDPIAPASIRWARDGQRLGLAWPWQSAVALAFH